MPLPPAPHSRMSSEDLPVQRLPRAPKDDVLVDEAALESFPASDPPAWTPTHAGSHSRAPVKVETPRELRSRLRTDVDSLTLESRDRARAVAEIVTTSLLEAGRHVVRIPVATPRGGGENIEAVIRGTVDGAEVVVGTAYEGDDDIASRVAVLLGLARVLESQRFERTVRLVAFADGGARAYAKGLRAQGIGVRGMLSLQSVGFHRHLHDRQRLPFPLRVVTRRLLAPWEGHFVAFVGDRSSRAMAEELRVAFGAGTTLEARAIAVPALFPLVSSSDHRAFTEQGFPAILLTDSGPLRSHCRHAPKDLAEMLSYDDMADVVFGLAATVKHLAGEHALVALRRLALWRMP